MRLARTAIALLVGANLVAAGVLGPLYGTSNRLQSRASFIPASPSSGAIGILPRAGPTCSCINKCARKDWHVDSKNCARCLPCPKGQVADSKSGYKRCVKDNGKTDDDDKKKRRQAKEKRWPAVKKILKDKFKDREPERKKRQDDRKLKRLGLCTVVAPLGISWDFLEEVADEFFDEDYLGSGEMLKHWPENLVIDEWELDAWNDGDEEKFYKGDAFLEPWIAHVNSTRSVPVTIVGIGRKREAGPEYGVSERLERRGIHKRFFQTLVSLIKGVATTVSRGGRGKGGVSADGKTLLPMPKMRFGARGKKGKKSREDQDGKIKEMLDKGPMRWCLEKRAPPTNNR